MLASNIPTECNELVCFILATYEMSLRDNYDYYDSSTVAFVFRRNTLWVEKYPVFNSVP